MKSLTILGACLMVAVSASAQLDVVKEGERAMKKGTAPEEIVKILNPAFTNPETANLAQTWYIPGKAMFNRYDEYFGLKGFNKLPNNGVQIMCNDLLNGYDYFVKSMSFDSIPDAKGKVKPKYSKEIISILAGHLADYNNAAVELWGLHDYKGAFKAWDDYIEIASDPRAKVPLADTIIAEVLFNQGIAAWQFEDFDLALKSFLKAKAKGYDKKSLYDYGISVAMQGKNEDAVFALAQEAHPKYGDVDDSYMNLIINHYLTTKDYDTAQKVIGEAIAGNPSNAQYYVVQGVLYENRDQEGDKELAKAAYKKAISIKPDHAAALYNYGRLLFDEASVLSDNAPLDSQAYNEYYVTKIKPILLEAVNVLEDSYNADDSNIDVLRYLENIYYNLQDEKNLEYTKQRMNN